jgi:hypothetical protein
VVVKNQDDYNSVDIANLQRLTADYIVSNKDSVLKPITFVYPQSYGSFSFFAEGDNLYIGSIDRNQINAMVDSFQSANLPIVRENLSRDIVQATEDALKAQY